MFCRNCGHEVPANAYVCPSCGVKPPKGNKFCPNCGVGVALEADVCLKCGASLAHGKDWLITLLLSIFLGTLGVDRFYLEKWGTAVLKLLVFLILIPLGAVTMGILMPLILVWWIVDIILIATEKMTDGKGQPLVGK